MARGESRLQVVDEKTAEQYAWVPGDMTCPLLLLFSEDLRRNEKFSVKGCETVGIHISRGKILMEEACPKNCSWKRMNQ